MTRVPRRAGHRQRTARGAGPVPRRAAVRHPRGYADLPESPAGPPDRDGGQSGVPVPAASWPPSSSGGRDGSCHTWHAGLGYIRSAAKPGFSTIIGGSFAAFAAYFSIKVGRRTTARTAQRPNVRQPGKASLQLADVVCQNPSTPDPDPARAGAAALGQSQRPWVRAGPNRQACPARGTRRCHHHRRRPARVSVATAEVPNPSSSGCAARAWGGRVGGRGLLGSRAPASPGPPRRWAKGRCCQTQTSHRFRPTPGSRGVMSSRYTAFRLPPGVALPWHLGAGQHSRGLSQCSRSRCRQGHRST
jgi:hypothetical protein